MSATAESTEMCNKHILWIIYNRISRIYIWKGSGKKNPSEMNKVIRFIVRFLYKSVMTRSN